MISLTRSETLAADRARELVVFADGVAELYPELARKSRLTANDLLEILPMLAAERTARLAIQAARDRLMKQRFPGAA